MSDELQSEKTWTEPESPTETEQPERRWGRLREFLARSRRLIARIWSPITRALAWLRRPDEIGQPLTLQPRGVRLLVLLILGNLIVLALLVVALYQAASLPVSVELLQLGDITNPGLSPIPAGPHADSLWQRRGHRLHTATQRQRRHLHTQSDRPAAGAADL